MINPNQLILRAMDAMEEANAQLMELAEKIQDNTEFIKGAVIELVQSAVEAPDETVSSIEELWKMHEAKVTQAENKCCEPVEEAKEPAKEEAKTVADMIDDIFPEKPESKTKAKFKPGIHVIQLDHNQPYASIQEILRGFFEGE